MKRIRCQYCDKMLKLENLKSGHEYRCTQCDSLIYRPGESNFIISTLAISTLIVFFWALTEPLLNVNILYDTQISIIQSIILLSKSDIISAIILILTIIIIPISIIILIFLIIFYRELKISIESLKILIATYLYIKEWNMIFIYFVGLLVSMVKITDISNMTILTGLWINALYVILLYLTVVWFNPYDVLHINVKKKI